jgi:hypothetical protein
VAPGLSAGALVGITIGVMLVLFAIVLVLLYTLGRARRRVTFAPVDDVIPVVTAATTETIILSPPIVSDITIRPV